MTAAPERRHGLDALRAAAMLLGVVLHSFLAYTGTPWIVRDQPMTPWLAWLVPAIHTFRMPLFFLLSGFFTAMLWQKRGRSQMIRQRAARIALPLALGLVTIVPLQWTAIAWASQVSSQPVTAQRDVWTAAMLGDVGQIRAHLARGASPNAPDPALGVTPVSWATLQNHPRVVRVLLDSGGDPNAPNRDGNRPLHTAVFLGRAEIGKALLAAGADLNLPDASGYHVTQIALADRATTEAIVATLGISAPWDEVSTGRQALRPLLGPDVFLTPKQTAPAPVVQALMDIPVFHHLWFLWHLCWLIGAFWLFTLVADSRGWPRPTYRMWFLAPLVAATAWLFQFMGEGLGTDTAIGLIPYPRVLATYALFFAAGAWLYLSNGIDALLDKGKWVLAPAAAALAAALALEYTPLAQTPLPALVPATLEALASWGLVIGLMAVTHQRFAQESVQVKIAADSAYWIYLLHLPLIVAGQGALSRVALPSEVKALALCIVVTSMLFALYVTWVRYSWVGWLLNGRRAPRTQTTRS